MSEIQAIFIQEARDQIAELETGLMKMEKGDRDPETVNAIFRAAHTIKGGSGVVELSAIEAFTHTLENTLDRVRNGELGLDAPLIALLLTCCDHLANLLDATEQGGSGEQAEIRSAGDDLGRQLMARLDANDAGADKAERITSVVEAAGASEREACDAGAIADDTWHISVRFGRDVLRNGMDPIAFLRYLLTLGEIAHITTVFDAMPDAQEMEPESCYLGFEIRFRSHADKAAIERVFEFVRSDCELHILPPHSKLAEFLCLIAELPEDDMRVGEILVKSGALTQDELESALHRQEGSKPAAPAGVESAAVAPKLGAILVEQRAVQSEIVEAAVVKQAQSSEKRAAEARLIRVQADKLDQLIDLVGELVIAGASAGLLAQKSGETALVETTSVLSRLVENIRDAALQLRMVQIGETFNRFNRVIRDVAKELNKEIELVITGGETDLDKSVVEKIGDPLMHLVRNAIGHGIEPADVRVAAGKPAKGCVTLNAFHDSRSIVIEVSDDGGGLKRERILAKAVEKGLLPAGATLSEQEIINLIFEAGFSTVNQVSNLSGRGVGMDVVRRNVQALRGNVEVHTDPGRGSRFTIRLPLTLAIIDGFLVGVERASFVIPLDMVVECLELPADAADRHYLNLRGEVLPFVRLRELFEVAGEYPRRENVVVIRSGAHQAGVVVDQLLGEFQTVIKPLSGLFRNLRGIGGSTILGTGEVALILDVQALTQLAARRETESRSVSASAPAAFR
ncbi:MAG: chemotaxis protein CheA [Betaproteobacteria bacterium]|nr:chemotaxis protein CheA [Betaproteobacteria bacterium]